MEAKAVIVEDEQPWVEAIATVLKAFGIESVDTTDPNTAEKLLKDPAFKVLVADLNLGKPAPPTTIFDVVQKLKRTDVLVIILSSFASEYNRQLESARGDNIGGMIARLASKVWMQIHKDDILDTMATGKKAPVEIVGLPRLGTLLKKRDLVGEILRRYVYYRSPDGSFEYCVHRKGTATGRWGDKKLRHTAAQTAIVRHLIVETMAGRSVPTEELLDKYSERYSETHDTAPDYVTSYDKVLKVFRGDPLHDNEFFKNASQDKYALYKASPFI